MSVWWTNKIDWGFSNTLPQSLDGYVGKFDSDRKRLSKCETLQSDNVCVCVGIPVV